MTTPDPVQAVSARLDDVVARLNTYDQTLKARFDSVEANADTANRKFEELTGKLDKFAELLNKNAEDNSGRQALLDNAIQEMNARTQAQLKAGDERITARLAELDTYMKEAFTKLLGQVSDITAQLSVGHKDHEDRMQKMEYNLTAAAAAMSTVVSNVDDIKTEMEKMKGAPPVGGSSLGAGGSGRDPWSEALAGSSFRLSGPSLDAQRGAGAKPSLGLGALKEKDFSSVDKFDGQLGKYADWSDRMLAKLRRQCPSMAEILKWAENQTEPITEDVEKQHSEFGVDLVDASSVLADILMVKTAPHVDEGREGGGGTTSEAS